MIIRSHEPVMEGFEKTSTNVVTIFSSPDYAGATNKGGITIYNNFRNVNNQQDFKHHSQSYISRSSSLRIKMDGFRRSTIKEESLPEIHLD